MNLHRLYRAIIDWASQPVLSHDNENELWSLSPETLADLPIGPEPDNAPSAFDRARRDLCA